VTSLSGRVAFITGASRGIGKAIAERCASAGAIVVACARVDHAQAVVETIVASGGAAVAQTLDVTDQESVNNAVNEVLNRYGHIDIVVNNAGIVRDQLLMRMKSEDWDKVLATNLTAAFRCSQAVLRPMLKRRYGRIINISSIVGQSGSSGQTNYAASKEGLVGFTRSLAREVAARGITVNVVSPGMIETDMTAALSVSTREALATQIPIGRFGTTKDVAGAVCFLASDEAAYITGQVLSVNGGMYM
tara:strand:+ start:4354 stop:5094 length:741 start_codon:yes stop_codon:yes gene_type:complete